MYVDTYVVVNLRTIVEVGGYKMHSNLRMYIHIIQLHNIPAVSKIPSV